MSALYEQLRAAGSDRERRAITGEVIDEMRLNPHDNVANEAYFSLCDRVINNLGHTAVGRPIDYNGQFPPMVSAFLVMTAPRVSGFLGAIHALPKVRTAIEAGPGASAIFSVAAAWRGAHVVGMEINEQAAECATEVV
ncbi:MAG TPA: hypothetical protein VLF62_03260, partial [Candidatus Saccharimonadales bacterium]|nr:hypothetical protein [Candidatus Saccharimonadales bacterium]